MLNMASVRMARFVSHLVKQGWQPDIVTAEESRYSVLDEELARRIPGQVTVFRDAVHEAGSEPTASMRAGGELATRPSLRPGGLLKAGARLVRQWLPEANEPQGWSRQAVEIGMRLTADRRYDCIFSSSGPLTAHRVAGSLAQARPLPWIAEFRDGVLDNPYLKPPTRWHRRHYQNYEEGVIQRARRVVVTSPTLGNLLRGRYGNGIPVAVVPNAYDPSEYPAGPEGSGTGFRLTYAGTLYGARSILPFLRGWKVWLDRGARQEHDPHLDIYGQSFNADLVDHIHRNNLNDTVRHNGSRRHSEVMRAIAESRGVLVIKSPEDRIHIPGKLYESLGVGRPILLLGPASDASGLIERHSAGICIASSEPAAIAAGLERMARWPGAPITPPAEYRADAVTACLVKEFERATLEESSLGRMEVPSQSDGEQLHAC